MSAHLSFSLEYTKLPQKKWEANASLYRSTFQRLWQWHANLYRSAFQRLW